MRYFDTHLHLPTPDEAGLDRLLRHVDGQGPGLVGGLLILNTPREVDFALAHLDDIPPQLLSVPFYDPHAGFPAGLDRTGWYKIHPDLHRLDRSSIAPLVDHLVHAHVRPQGLIVHCYPWGTRLESCISVPLVVALAEALPDVAILATHGGGYDSWPLRAHTGSLPNVLYDFSVTLSYFRGADAVRPYGVYMRTKPGRVLFGSDWPSADPGEQWRESVRLADEAGITAESLEQLFLENSRRYWPEPFTARTAENGGSLAAASGKE